MEENDITSLSKYFEYLKLQGYDRLRPSKKESQASTLPELIAVLCAEGEILLNTENSTVEPPANAKVLEHVLGEKSKNPYIQARCKVLTEMSAFRRQEIEEMESTGNIYNRIYAEFVKMVTDMGDKLSDKTI